MTPEHLKNITKKNPPPNDKEIQNWIENNMYYQDDTPMIDTVAFYEGAKWMREQMKKI